MVSPFRSEAGSGESPDLAPLMDILEDLRAEADLEALFSRSVGTQLDRAIFTLVGESPLVSPYQTDDVLPDPRRTGSTVDQAEEALQAAQATVRAVLENSGQFPVSGR